MNEQFDYKTLLLLPAALFGFGLLRIWQELQPIGAALFGLCLFAAGAGFLYWFATTRTVWGRECKKRRERLRSIPSQLLIASENAVVLGHDEELGETIYLPDSVRTRHVHVIGATGSGKTESVILNLLRQDVRRGYGSIILDAKGDYSFLRELNSVVVPERLKVFDLSSPDSTPYDALKDGSPLEAAQRLFASLTWSEEYYKSKALSSLQRIFEVYFLRNKTNPMLTDVAEYLESSTKYAALLTSTEFPKALALDEFKEISGLRDQVRSLVTGHLGKSSPVVVNPQSRFIWLSPETLSIFAFRVSCPRNWSQLLDAS